MTDFFLDLGDPDFAGKVGPMMEVMKLQEPLPCVLICTAFLDKAVLGLLEEILAGGESRRKLLESDKGALGSLFSRAKMAYLLGLIDKRIFENIGHICTIRNLFAHSHVRLDFDSDDIAKWCNKLTGPAPIDSSMAEAARVAIGHLPTKVRFCIYVTEALLHIVIHNEKARRIGRECKNEPIMTEPKADPEKAP